MSGTMYLPSYDSRLSPLTFWPRMSTTARSTTGCNSGIRVDKRGSSPSFLPISRMPVALSLFSTSPTAKASIISKVGCKSSKTISLRMLPLLCWEIKLIFRGRFLPLKHVNKPRYSICHTTKSQLKLPRTSKSSSKKPLTL
jgi:hypothetical protein